MTPAYFIKAGGAAELAGCAGFPPVVRDLIRSTGGNGILRNDLYDFPPLRHWTDKRMALMGDAAHATTLNLGQGACQAIEDACVIAEQLSLNTDIASGLKAFEEIRHKKASYITNTSWQFARLTNTTGMAKAMVMRIMRLTPGSVNEKQLDKIYSLNY